MIETNHLYGYALTFPNRDPFYLPLTMRPSSIGYPRNLTLDQPPGSEKTFVLGDGMRKVEPLQLQGEVFAGLFVEKTEDAARIWLEQLDAAVRTCTGVQRGQSIQRSLHAGGWMVATPGTTPLDWNITLHLLPTGPSWTDATTGRAVPF